MSRGLACLSEVATMAQ